MAHTSGKRYWHELSTRCYEVFKQLTGVIFELQILQLVTDVVAIAKKKNKERDREKFIQTYLKHRNKNKDKII